MDSRVQVLEIPLQVCLVVLPCHPVYSRYRVALQGVERQLEQVGIDVVQQRGEPFLLPDLCCLTYALQRLGHASPHLRAVRALPDRVPLDPRPLLCRLRRRKTAGLVRRLHRSYGRVSFLGSCIAGYGSSPSRHGPAMHRRPSPRSPGSRARSFRTCQGLRPRRVHQTLALACW